MATFYLLRHGEADFRLPAQWKANGWGADLAPLSSRGIEQVQAVAERLRQLRPEIVLSSPMTRALHSTLLLSSALQLPCVVEFALHEWVPDLSFSWTSVEEVLASLADLEACGCEWPPGEKRPWEPLSSVRTRVLQVFARYQRYERVLVVCHGIVIRSLTGRKEVHFAEIVPFENVDPPGIGSDSQGFSHDI